MSFEGPGEPQWLREDEPAQSWETDVESTPSAPMVRPAVVVWALAAVVAIITPFLTINDQHFEGLHVSTDGWGRVHVHQSEMQGVVGVVSASPGHSTRTGILFAVATALLLLAIVAWVSRGARIGAVLGSLGSAVLVACAGFVGLTADAVTSISSRQQTVQLGAGVWLSVAAGVLALLGVVLAARELVRTG